MRTYMPITSELEKLTLKLEGKKGEFPAGFLVLQINQTSGDVG